MKYLIIESKLILKKRNSKVSLLKITYKKYKFLQIMIKSLLSKMLVGRFNPKIKKLHKSKAKNLKIIYSKIRK